MLSSLFCFQATQDENPDEIESPVYGDEGELGAAKLHLTGSRHDDLSIQSIYISVQGIDINSTESGWQEVVDFTIDGDLPQGRVIDLLTLQNGSTAGLGAFQIAPGTYEQIRIRLGEDNYVNVTGSNGETVKKTLKTPSGGQSGVKLTGPFEIAQQGYTTVTIAFDTQNSIVRTGTGANQNNSHNNDNHEYLLKPVAKILSVNTQAGASQNISASAGGSVALVNEIELNIPAGALNADTIIEIVPQKQAPYNPPFSGESLASETYELLPDKTQFAQNIFITVYYDPVQIALLGLDLNTLQVAYYDESRQDWTGLAGVIDQANHSVTAQVNHFTRFGVTGAVTGPRINPAEILYAGLDPVTNVAATQVPEMVSAKVSATAEAAIRSVTLHYAKEGALQTPLQMAFNAVTQRYEVVLPASLFYELTTTASLDVCIEALDSAGRTSYAPAACSAASYAGFHNYAYSPDADLDGMNDRWEWDFGLNPALQDGTNNPDGDALTNVEEYLNGSNPLVFDVLSQCVLGLAMIDHCNL